MRQVVRAPLRAYFPVLPAALLPFVLILLDMPDGTLVDYLIVAAFASLFLGFGAFLLHMVNTMVISIHDQTLLVRETAITLDEIVDCQVIDGPPEAQIDDVWRYRRESQDRLLLFVPQRADRMVEVTLSTGKRVAFSAQDPEAICAVLRSRCQNLA